MKKVIGIAAALLLTVSSCDNEFSVNDEWSDVTVVYSLLDAAADTNWVRIERGYLGNRPANESFGVADSFYYKDVTAYLLGYKDNGKFGKADLVDSLYLTKDETSRKLELGVFTQDGYHLYRTTETLDDELVYRLKVEKENADAPVAMATTKLLAVGTGFSDFGIKTPRPVSFPRIYSQAIEWYTSDNATIYQVEMEFWYKEFNCTTKQEELKSILMDISTVSGIQAQGSGGFVKLQLRYAALYDMISNRLEPIEDGYLRFFDQFKIFVHAGGEDLEKYMILNQPNDGVGQDKPEFPGIENGTGLFSSRTSTEMEDIELNAEQLGKYYKTASLCELGFAVAESGDTFRCEIQGNAPTKVKVQK